MTDNQLLVEEELQVLESIYPDYILESNPKSVQLEITVELDTPRAVSVFTNNLPVNPPDNGSSISLSYLPPIILSLQLPNGYPTDCPPIIASLHATHSWLPSGAQLASLLTGAWTEGESVLCYWVELVRSGEFLDRLHLVDHSGHIWHGPISACPKSVTLTAVMEYLDLPEGSPERAALERQFGRSTLLKLVKEYEEEKSTVEWLQNSTTACPGCSVPVEKSVGCNHMKCAKCNQHFCYRCGAKLSASNPYAHFSTGGSKCYGKLFDFNNSSEEDGWQRVEWFEAL
ncbi:hypothetical protein A7U60_g1565 [Sanghuangporus baumii]|uniref:RBR-type E3 ubiquitin transferase n=1 Tax=Sanghuangporus baumii TaxID=108892 RepID=A0A9Q5N934_SANBA|nr:hypothetical protein A7U60_g1565 [Sanghuangporus baumii]